MCVVAAALAAPACVTQSKYLDLEQRTNSLEDQLDAAEANLADAEDLIMDLDAQGQDVEEWKARAAALEAQMAELRSAGGIPGVDGTDTVYYAEGAYGYQLAGDLTFSSGSADLTTRGKQILKDVAAQVKSYGGMIRVDGHTDTDPIKKTKAKWPNGNIQLGAGRAIAVYKFLIANGVNENQLFISSYGPNKPVIDGRTSGAKAKNRRVEVLMIYDGSQG
jgi:chemotaxis protein MotB